MADLVARVRELEALLAERDEQLGELAEQLGERDARIAKLEKQVEKLREIVTSNSSNSSKPPSTDRGKNRSREGSKGKRKGRRGAKKGHKGTRRALVPPERLDESHDHHPDECSKCGEELTEENDVGEPYRHQTFEIPPVQIHAREDRLHSRACGDCGTVTKAQLPDDVSAKAFGPRLVAFIVLLTGVYRLSKRRTVQFLGAMFGLDISLGSISRCEAEMSDALADPHAEALEAARAESTGYVDETSWQEQNKTHWLWVMVTSVATVFLIRKHRDTATARELLGSFAGTLVADRLATYAYWDGLRQVCWAHILRLLVRFSEAAEGSFRHQVGTRALKATKTLFRQWHRYKEGEIGRSTLKRRTIEARREIVAALKFGESTVDAWLAGKCKALLEYESSFFSFIFHEGIEPTNNHAERALRHAVILRKLTFGTQSSRGSRFLERMFTVVETLRAANGNVAEFLHEAIAAKRGSKPVPSLLGA